MPEGPEILHIKTFIKDKFLGGKIKINYDEMKDKINNCEIIDISCKGKLLYFKIKNTQNIYYLHVHLGLSGWIMFKDAKYVKYQFSINKNDKEHNIFIEDKSRLSNMELFTEEEHNKYLLKLGIDIFTNDFTKEKFKEKIKSKKMILASFLLNQEIFCGIGNYIKNEVLYMGKLDIKIKTNELSEKQIEELYDNILFVAYSCLIEQLDNLKIKNKLPEENKVHMPKNLEVPYEYKIYKRETTIDGKLIKITKVGGRDTYYVE